MIQWNHPVGTGHCMALEFYILEVEILESFSFTNFK